MGLGKHHLSSKHWRDGHLAKTNTEGFLVEVRYPWVGWEGLDLDFKNEPFCLDQLLKDVWLGSAAGCYRVLLWNAANAIRNT